MSIGIGIDFFHAGPFCNVCLDPDTDSDSDKDVDYSYPEGITEYSEGLPLRGYPGNYTKKT